MLPSPFLLSSEQREKRSLTEDVIPFLHNLIFQYTNPLSFETEPHSIHTTPLIREHYDSYLYYFRYKTLEITKSQILFQIILNPNNNKNIGTYYRTINSTKHHSIYTRCLDHLYGQTYRTQRRS